MFPGAARPRLMASPRCSSSAEGDRAALPHGLAELRRSEAGSVGVATLTIPPQAWSPSMRQRSSGWRSTGSSDASWPQYSNTSPLPHSQRRQRRPVVGPEPGEERQLVRPGEHVDGVDLHEAHPVEHPPEVAPVDPPGGPRVVEALGVEGDAAGLAAAERVGRQGHDPAE